MNNLKFREMLIESLLQVYSQYEEKVYQNVTNTLSEATIQNLHKMFKIEHQHQTAASILLTIAYNAICQYILS